MTCFDGKGNRPTRQVSSRVECCVLGVDWTFEKTKQIYARRAALVVLSDLNLL